MNISLHKLAALLLSIASVAVSASQIAPLGSSFEASLTREPESSLARMADHLGVLIKSPVHEELTQLGFGCAVEASELSGDDKCATKDLPWVTPYVIYGVRWNDLPPFRLSPGEGAQCRRIFSAAAACRVDQTVRFSTQPECWYCLFKAAEKRALRKKVAGCKKGPQYARGNFMTRSHFGDLQFLHSMASGKGEAAVATQTEILHWLEFAWKVTSEEIGPEHKLRDVPLSTFRDRFQCSEWTVADIYILGRGDKLLPHIRHIAFGSLLHVVQDSFSEAHVDRIAASQTEQCPAIGEPMLAQPGRIRQFYTYAGQDGHLHDVEDKRDAMVKSVRDRHPEALAMTELLYRLYDKRFTWAMAEPYLRCMFDLVEQPMPSSPGDRFTRPTAAK